MFTGWPATEFPIAKFIDPLIAEPSIATPSTFPNISIAVASSLAPSAPIERSSQVIVPNLSPTDAVVGVANVPGEYAITNSEPDVSKTIAAPTSLFAYFLAVNLPSLNSISSVPEVFLNFIVSAFISTSFVGVLVPIPILPEEEAK